MLFKRHSTITTDTVGWAIAVIIIVVLLLMGTIFVVLRYRKQHIHVDPKVRMVTITSTSSQLLSKVSDSNFQMNPNFGSVRISNGDLSVHCGIFPIINFSNHISLCVVTGLSYGSRDAICLFRCAAGCCGASHQICVLDNS